MRPALALALSLAACQLMACQSNADYASDMREQHDGDAPTATPATDGADAADVEAEEVTYATVGGVPVTGTLARPRGAGAGLPGVVVIHEWWGLNQNVESMARRVAALGYAALAVDLYGGQTATAPDRAMGLMEAAMRREGDAEENLRQAVDYLRVEAGAVRVGVLGWCFGGMWSLRAALAAPDAVDAAVVYYGRPVTDPARLRALGMPVLAHFGEADDSIPRDTVSAFIGALAEAGVEHEVFTYAGAAHAFANPSGQAYDARAAEAAWQRTTAFLAEHLGAGPVAGPAASD